MANQKSSQVRADTFRLETPHLQLQLADGEAINHKLQEETSFVGAGKDAALAASINKNDLVEIFFEVNFLNRQFTLTQLPDLSVELHVNDEALANVHTLAHGDVLTITSADGQIGSIAVDLGFMAVQEPVSTKDAALPSAFQNTVPAESAYFEMRWPDGQQVYFPLGNKRVLLGRSSSADLQLPQAYVSNKHAEIIYDAESGYQITDLESTNGTRLNNRPLKPNQPHTLTNDSIIRIGDDFFGMSIGLTFRNPAENLLPYTGYLRSDDEPTLIVNVQQVMIGSASQCDLVLSGAGVLPEHARLRRMNGTFHLEALTPKSETLLNGKYVTRAEVQEGDRIEIGHHVLVLTDGKLIQHESYGMRVDVEGLSKTVKSRGKELEILHDISMTVMPREFVAIVGGSGAGKSTLMKALVGLSPGAGGLWVNGRNFYEDYAHFRDQIGYVPQSDILHTSLTTEQALRFAARLRLPSTTTTEEREQRINTVLDTVEMNTETLRRTKISRLSGGQRKRVSIAAELLADPKLIFLDEATSGLDPGLEMKMMHTLRRMADEGRTVILITHATANIVQADYVAFMSEGRMVYFGAPQQALPFFDVENFSDIYRVIERKGENWQKIFRQSKPDHYNKFVVERQKTRQQVTESAPPPVSPSLAERLRTFARQFSILTQRAFAVFRSDPITMGLMIAMLPVMAILQLLISTPDILTGVPSILADPIAAAASATESYIPIPETNPFVFVMALEAVLVGMYLPSNELIRERSVFLRERMVNLKLPPYLLSKGMIFALFALIQCILYWAVIAIGVRLPAEGVYLPGYLELVLTLFITTVAAIGIGLVISAVSRSTEMAIYIMTLLVFFHLFFAGTMYDLRENPAEPLSYVTATRWSLLAMGETLQLDELAESTIVCEQSASCFNYPQARESLTLPYGEENAILQSWAILIGLGAVFYSLLGIILHRTKAS